MAFELYAGSLSTSIEHHEEGIFGFVDADKHPQLSRMKASFYSDPAFSPEQSNDLVHELISLIPALEGTKETKYLASVLSRLLVFFSAAYVNDEQVRSESD
ncbi:MAG TPA: hypothetical protein EYH51_03355 [Pseudomonas pachastrellae]|nr:hypothetical protein [Halopseudomonas pachastrellae]